jgi:hypothetical protein
LAYQYRPCCGVLPPSISCPYIRLSLLSWSCCEEVTGIETVGFEDRAAVAVDPLGARAVVVELDPVAVGVGEVHRDVRTVVEAGMPGWGGLPPALSQVFRPM